MPTAFSRVWSKFSFFPVASSAYAGTASIRPKAKVSMPPSKALNIWPNGAQNGVVAKRPCFPIIVDRSFWWTLTNYSTIELARSENKLKPCLYRPTPSKELARASWLVSLYGGYSGSPELLVSSMLVSLFSSVLSSDKLSMRTRRFSINFLWNDLSVIAIGRNQHIEWTYRSSCKNIWKCNTLGGLSILQRQLIRRGNSGQNLLDCGHDVECWQS